MTGWYEAQKVIEIDRSESHAWAENERLARQVARQDDRAARAYQRLAVQFGERLVAWGNRLQMRYTPVDGQRSTAR